MVAVFSLAGMRSRVKETYCIFKPIFFASQTGSGKP
jgi:hypothetical protein